MLNSHKMDCLHIYSFQLVNIKFLKWQETEYGELVLHFTTILAIYILVHDIQEGVS